MKIEHERLKGQAEQPEYSFEPHINKKSQLIAQKRLADSSNTRPEDRLIKSGVERQNKIEKMRQSATEGWFRPEITSKSKEIVMRKTGKLPPEKKLTKKEIGKVGNLTFYDASVEKDPRLPKGQEGKRVRNNDGLRK